MVRLILFLVAFVLAAVAQHSLATGGTPGESLWLFLPAGIIFAAASLAPLPWPVLPPARSWKRMGLGLALFGVLLAAISMVRFWSGHYDEWAFWVWLAAIGLYLVGVWLDGPSPARGTEVQAERAWPQPKLDRRLVFILLALILLVAVATRFYALDTFPNGCQSDECNNGLVALNWLQGAPYMPFVETNEGQATLFTYIIAALISIFGRSVHTMRMASALVGTMTVLVFYFLAREIFDRRVALLATALLAADRWHITFSRIVYELILMPLVLSLQLLFLLKALKTGRRRWWALSGMMLALGMNTYTAYRVVPFFMTAYFLYWLVTHRRRIRRDFEGMLVFAGGALVVVAPLGIYAIRNWKVFVSRINHISVFHDVEAVGNYEPLWSNLRKTLYAFNWRGDLAALNNLPGAPLLQAAVALLFVLGIAWAIRWFWRELPFLYLVWFVAIASLAVFSVAHEAPSARRLIGLLPLTYLCVATVFDQIWQAWDTTWEKKRWQPMAVGLLIVVLFAMISNVNTYFRVQAVDAAVWGAYSPSESAIGKYLAQIPDDERVYLSPQYMHHSAISIIGGPGDIVSLNFAEHIPLREDPGGDVTFILQPTEDHLAPILQQLYPSGEYEVHRDRFGRTLFLTYRIPRSALDAAHGWQAAYIPGEDPTQAPMRGDRISVFDVDFTAGRPLAPPFVARYESALLVPQYGDYAFELTATGGTGKLFLDDVEVLSVEDGVEQVEHTLAGGFLALRVEYIAGDEPGLLRLSWATPQNPRITVIPATSFFTLPGASHGLVGYYFITSDWSGSPTIIQRDLFIIPNDFLHESYSIRWVGKIAAPSTGTYIFGTLSDDGSFVYIDGRLVVDNRGLHGAEYREGAINLEEGLHDIEVLYNQFGGSRAMGLWWKPPRAVKGVVSSNYLYPVEIELPQGPELPSLPSIVIGGSTPSAPISTPTSLS